MEWTTTASLSQENSSLLALYL